jgi:hypothetical protein
MSIAQGMRQSRTLVAVHLSGNNMSEVSTLLLILIGYQIQDVARAKK